MPIKAAYTGKGEHYMGIPARDVVDEEWERLTDEQRETIRGSAFYRMIEAPLPKRSEAKAPPVSGEVPDAPKAAKAD